MQFSLLDGICSHSRPDQCEYTAFCSDGRGQGEQLLIMVIRDPKTSYETTGWWTLSQLIPRNYWDKEYWRWWNTWGAMCLVYAVLRINWLQRFFSSRPLAYLGRISFMLYLTQAPILWTFADRIFRLFGQKQQDNITTWWDDKLPIPDWGIHGLTTRFVLSQIIVLPVQFLLAEIATRVIDGPSISIGRWIVTKLGVEQK